jgi:hypothetical protein
MDAQLLELARGERARYFAPTSICTYLALLCVALTVTAAFIELRSEALAVAAVGSLGALASGALGMAFYRAQQRDRRYHTVPTSQDAATNFAAVRAEVLTAGWTITREDPDRSLDARTDGAMRLAGELVAVRFAESRVRVASICDPGVGFSLPGRRRCAQHRERIRRAVTGPADA